MKEGRLGAWLKQPGDQIKVGDEILEVETDKISNVVEAGDSGKLRRIVGTPDTVYPVKALLAVLADDEVPDAEIDAFVASYETPAPDDSSEAAGASRYAFVELPSGRVRYAVEGRNSQKVVLVHGFGGDADNWLFNIGALAEVATVYALDLPGHGQSTKQLKDASVDGLAATLTEFLDVLDIGPAHLVGHSMGGAVVLKTALNHPNRVRSLTLICPASLGAEIDAGYIDGFTNASSRRDLKPVLERLFDDPALVSRQLIDELLKYKRIDGVQAALSALSNNLFPNGKQSAVYIDKLTDITCPTLVIWGANDKVIPASQAESLPAAISVHSIEGAGHMVQMEKAGKVNELLRDQISR
jgi:pyruvate dehydrogenase E2 component (dihydrolipoamide acetyltransferase)